MADGNARAQTLDLLDRRAFDPVLNATHQGNRKKTVDARKTTRSIEKVKPDLGELEHKPGVD